MGEWLPGTAIGTRFRECVRVSACTNGKAESVMIINDAAVIEKQQCLFMKVGHKAISVSKTTLLVDPDGKYITVDRKRGKECGIVQAEAVSSKYMREEIWPGIKVRIYDRDVLKRPRATKEQVAVVTLISLTLTAILAFFALRI